MRGRDFMPGKWCTRCNKWVPEGCRRFCGNGLWCSTEPGAKPESIHDTPPPLSFFVQRSPHMIVEGTREVIPLSWDRGDVISISLATGEAWNETRRAKHRDPWHWPGT